MTPKGKAKNLVELNYSYISDGAIIDKRLMNWWVAKQCAIIAVNEIIKATKGYIFDTDYWKDVKSEIERL